MISDLLTVFLGPVVASPVSVLSAAQGLTCMGRHASTTTLARC